MLGAGARVPESQRPLERFVSLAGLTLAALLSLHAASHWIVHDWLFVGGAEPADVVPGVVGPSRAPPVPASDAVPRDAGVATASAVPVPSGTGTAGEHGLGM